MKRDCILLFLHCLFLHTAFRSTGFCKVKIKAVKVSVQHVHCLDIFVYRLQKYNFSANSPNKLKEILHLWRFFVITTPPFITIGPFGYFVLKCMVLVVWGVLLVLLVLLDLLDLLEELVVLVPL